MNTFANNILIARARESDGRKLEEKLLRRDQWWLTIPCKAFRYPIRLQ